MDWQGKVFIIGVMQGYKMSIRIINCYQFTSLVIPNCDIEDIFFQYNTHTYDSSLLYSVS